MKLYILRHGEAGFSSGSDQDRVLTAKGIAEIQFLGAYLKQQYFNPRVTLVSPYERTQQTFRHLNNHASLDQTSLIAEQLTPDSSTKQVIALLKEHQLHESILLISHQPLVSCLISSLVTASKNQAVQFSMMPGSFAALTLHEIAQGCAECNFIKHPPFYDNQ